MTVESTFSNLLSKALVQNLSLYSLPSLITISMRTKCRETSLKSSSKSRTMIEKMRAEQPFKQKSNRMRMKLLLVLSLAVAAVAANLVKKKLKVQKTKLLK